MQNFLDSCLHGGETTTISAGEVHLPGRPKTASGTKALAILAAKAWANYRPGGMKVLGGAVILEKGLTEADFEEMSREGIPGCTRNWARLSKEPSEVAEMCNWAKKDHGCHDAFWWHVDSGGRQWLARGNSWQSSHTSHLISMADPPL